MLLTSVIISHVFVFEQFWPWLGVRELIFSNKYSNRDDLNWRIRLQYFFWKVAQANVEFSNNIC